MICGKCKARDVTTQHVRACYVGGSEQASEPDHGLTHVQGVPDGFYTVIFESGDYVTLRVATQPEDDAFLPSRVIVSYLDGPDNLTNYQSFAHVSTGGFLKVWRKHDPEGRPAKAAEVLLHAEDLGTHTEAYAEAMGRCSRCRRPLTVPASLHRGMGPICYEKAGIA